MATANDPQFLDAAILRRPGRFDRVVEFPAPDRGLRTRYLRKFLPHLTTAEVQRWVEQSDGLSFAQLREAYILAGQRAYEKGEKISGVDLQEAMFSLRRGMAGKGPEKPSLGFTAACDARPLPLCWNQTEQEGEW